MAEHGALYRYVCEYVIPGCEHTDESESRDELMERVEAHLSEYHKVDPHDREIEKALRTNGITFIRPA